MSRGFSNPARVQKYVDQWLKWEKTEKHKFVYVNWTVTFYLKLRKTNWKNSMNSKLLFNIILRLFAEAKKFILFDCVGQSSESDKWFIASIFQSFSFYFSENFEFQQLFSANNLFFNILQLNRSSEMFLDHIFVDSISIDYLVLILNFNCKGTRDILAFVS